MPNRFLYETAITIDHEAGTCLVDTTLRGIAAELRRRRFKDITTSESAPYHRFLGQADQVKFRLPKGQRRMTGAAAKRAPRNHHGGENPPRAGLPRGEGKGDGRPAKITPSLSLRNSRSCHRVAG